MFRDEQDVGPVCGNFLLATKGCCPVRIRDLYYVNLSMSLREDEASGDKRLDGYHQGYQCKLRRLWPVSLSSSPMNMLVVLSEATARTQALGVAIGP